MSATASFTPGPWEMVNDHPNPITAASLASIRPVKRPPDFYAIEIASVYGCTAEPRQRANARLIAAAPDLVAALHEALEFIDNQVDVVDGDYGIPKPNRAMQVAREIREALSKAGVGMTVETFDPHTYRLAEHILKDEPCRDDPQLYQQHCHSLALAIQQTVEDWCFDEVKP